MTDDFTPHDAVEPGLDWALLDRYFAGSCSPAERAEVDRWVAAMPDRRRRLARLREVWVQAGAPGDAGDEYDVDAALALSLRGLEEAEAISVRLGRHCEERSDEAISVTRGPRLLRSLRSLAMTTAVAVCLALAFAIVVRAPRARWHEYETGAGQRQKVTLADGTEFTLAPASRLRVPLDYASGDRDLSLDGEAFFSVMHDERHLFAVRAHGTIVRDVGTRFDIRAYSEDSTTRVIVAEGRVAVEIRRGLPAAQRGPNALLVAGDVAVIDTAVALAHGVDVAAMTAWTNGELRFVNTPVPEAIAEIERWYDVEIHVPAGMESAGHFTATFEHETVTQVLDILATSLSARVERSGRVATLIPLR